MPFFLIIPAWIFSVILGLALLCFRSLRRVALYLLSVATGATFVSLLLSTAVLYLGPRLGITTLGKWSGITLIACYIFAILVGGLAGALSGFWCMRKLLHA